MSKKFRPAIAMIELIFAIVIMGIVLMSAPQLISSAAKSGYVAIQQEAINEAASQVNMVMGYFWDEANVNESYLPSVLHVTAGNDDLNESIRPGLRKGVPLFSWRSFIREDSSELSASSTLGSEGGDRDDLDDFIGDTNMTLILASTADYIENDTVNINTAVSYITDDTTAITYDPNVSNKINFSPNFASTPAGTTNIKGITVTLTSTSGLDELDKNIILNAFSCNIGATKFEEETF